MDADAIVSAQNQVCQKHGLKPVFPDLASMIGVGRGFDNANPPIHGLRHPEEGQSCGWYIWTGELLDADDFFSPVHVHHAASLYPEILSYLALPPGWRFLIAPNYEDVWFDSGLLQV